MEILFIVCCASCLVMLIFMYMYGTYGSTVSKYISCISIFIFVSTLIACVVLGVHQTSDKYAKVESGEYTIYINGVETDIDKIDVYQYTITLDDEKKEAYLSPN